MKSNNKIVGHLGENLAAQYLIDHGYRILSRNFSTHFGEIDIIATINQIIVFIGAGVFQIANSHTVWHGLVPSIFSS